MENKKTLSEFARRAQQRLADKKVSQKFTVHVPSLGQDMVFRTLLDDETREILNMEDADEYQKDRFLIYGSAVEPSLRDIATELKEAGEITEYLQVVDMFPMRELNSLSKIIMEKSGVLGGEKPRIVDKAVKDIKN